MIEALLSMKKTLADEGLIVPITGAGNALGNAIRPPGGQPDGRSHCRVPSAGNPGATILAPMLASLGLNPVMTGLALCATAMFPPYMHDSYSWVVTRFSGFDVKTSL